MYPPEMVTSALPVELTILGFKVTVEPDNSIPESVSAAVATFNSPAMPPIVNTPSP